MKNKKEIGLLEGVRQTTKIRPGYPVSGRDSNHGQPGSSSRVLFNDAAQCIRRNW